MNFASMRVLLAAALLFVATVVLAAPGRPIGGVIVKGGKNPGGQMRTLARTDARGGFTIRFAEGGEYRLAFDGTGTKEFGAQVKAGVQVDYVIKRSAEVAAARKSEAANASRHTPLHNRLENGEMVVSIPQGGGEIRGVLQALTSDEAQAERAINESGVSASPSKPKGGVKK